ncbi:hypothetical protein Hanom_Chr09g00820491 [Helianthus anomalus]
MWYFMVLKMVDLSIQGRKMNCRCWAFFEDDKFCVLHYFNLQHFDRSTRA